MNSIEKPIKISQIHDLWYREKSKNVLYQGELVKRMEKGKLIRKDEDNRIEANSDVFFYIIKNQLLLEKDKEILEKNKEKVGKFFENKFIKILFAPDLMFKIFHEKSSLIQKKGFLYILFIFSSFSNKSIGEQFTIDTKNPENSKKLYKILSYFSTLSGIDYSILVKEIISKVENNEEIVIKELKKIPVIKLESGKIAKMLFEIISSTKKK